MSAVLKLEDVFDMDRAVGLTDAAKLMRGRGGKAPSVETVRRWASEKKGCWPQGKGEGKPQLVLMTVRINGELLTLPEWVQAFELERRRLGARLCERAVLPRTEAKRAKAHARAEAGLDRKGVRPR